MNILSSSPEPRRAGLRRILLLVLGLLAGMTAVTPSGSAAPLQPGDPFTDLASFCLEGTVPTLKGQVVLVDFFASWCGPCKDSFPVLQQLQQKYGAKGLVIVAVNVDKKRADMDGFVKKFQTDFAIVRDGANKLVAEVKVPTMPSSFVVGRDGKVVSVHRGFKGEETRKKYVEEIEALLK